MKTFRNLAHKFSIPKAFLFRLAKPAFPFHVQIGRNRLAESEEVARVLAEHRKEAQEMLNYLFEIT